MQVLNLFHTASFVEWRDDHIVMAHRAFVLVVGVATGALACAAGGGVCRKSGTALVTHLSLSALKATFIFGAI